MDDVGAKMKIDADASEVAKAASEVDRLDDEINNLVSGLGNLDAAFASMAQTSTRSASAVDNLGDEVNVLLAGLGNLDREFADIASDTTRYSALMEHASAETLQYAASLSVAQTAANSASGAIMRTGQTANAAGAMSGSATNKLMVLGQTLDDLQYVGEMGLRPILNNIMQIDPKIGIALIAIDQLHKHWSEITSLASGVADFWGFDGATAGATHLGSVLQSISATLKEAVAFVSSLSEGFDHMAGGPAKRTAETIKKYSETATKADVARGSAAVDAIDAYDDKAGRRGAGVDAIVKNFSPNGTKEETDKLKATLIEAIGKAKKGDRNALGTVKAWAGNTDIGKQIGDSDPEAVARRKADEKAAEKAKKDAKDRAKEREEATKAAWDAEESALKDQHDSDEKRGKRVADLAKDLGKSMIPRVLAGDTIGVSEVRDSLIRAGVKPKEAGSLAAETTARMNKDLNDKINERALETGKSAEEARADMAKEAANKRRDEAEKKAKEAAGEFKAADPNADKQVNRRLVDGMLSGRGDEAGVKLAEEIAKAMKDAGIGETDQARSDAAGGIVRDQRAKILADAEEAATKATVEAQRSPQTFGGFADFQRALTSAKGGGFDIGQKQLNAQETANARLLEIYQAISRQQIIPTWPGKR